MARKGLKRNRIEIPIRAAEKPIMVEIIHVCQLSRGLYQK